MKKILSLFLVITVVFSAFSVFSFATETEDLEHTDGYLLGDVDFDGTVSAADARAILRHSVSLESFSAEVIPYANPSMDEIISAADARLTLRTSVDLEKETMHNFEIINETDANCKDIGTVSARCKDCAVEITVEMKGAHDFVKETPCDTTAICSVCSEAVQVAPEHKMTEDICEYCGYLNNNGLYKKLTEFTRESGNYEDGIYVYGEDKSEYYAALCYSPDEDDLYLYTGMGIYTEDEYGETHLVEYYNYLDLENTFSEYIASIAVYSDSVHVIYADGVIDEKTANSDSPGAFTLTYYEAAEGIPEMQDEISVMSEAMSLEAVEWLEQLCQKHGIPLTAEKIGFVNLK